MRRGRVGLLWVPVHDGMDGTAPCTCVKSTSGAGERRCRSCYGARRAPGYYKFLHETIWWGQAEASAFTVDGVVLETDTKPHRFGLASGRLVGTAISNPKAFANTSGAAWAWHLDASLRSAGSAVETAFQVVGRDPVDQWTDIAELNEPGLQPIGAGQLRIRFTLRRPAAGDEGPSLEILRIRRPRVEAENRRILATVPEYNELNPGILFSRTPVILAPTMDPQRGRIFDHTGDQGWCAPLDFYDTTLVRDTEGARIDNRNVDPLPFYEMAGGVQTARRYFMTGISYNEELGMFTSQKWDDRLAQPEEWAVFVW